MFVSTDNGDYSIETVGIYPKNLNSAYELTSGANRPEPVSMDGTAFTPDPEKVLSNYNYALIIVAMDNARNWYNTSLIYNVLTQNYNYQEDNIFVLFSWDGNSTSTDYYNNLNGDAIIDDIDGPATYTNIQTTITNLTNDLKHGNQLAVFFTGVPVDNSGIEPLLSFPIDENTLGQYPVTTISQPMEDIATGQMILMFDLNSSTDVAAYFSDPIGDGVACPNRFLLCSTFSNEENQAEMYFSGGKYSEQLFYWASAARGFLPKHDEPWNTILPAIGYENEGGFPYNTILGLETHPGDNNLDDNLDGFIQMGEAFQYANDMNTWSDNGYCYIPFEPGESNFPSNIDEIPFIEDLLNLQGLCGEVENSQTLQGNFVTYAYLEIGEGVLLTFDNGSEININGGLNSNYETSSISFLENTIINPGQGGSISINNAGFSVGANSVFNKTDEEDLFIFINNKESLDFDQIDINRCYITFSVNNLNMNLCNINNTKLDTWGVETVNLDNSTFDGSSVVFDCMFCPPGTNSSLNIQNCTINQNIYELVYAFKALNYENVIINNNNFGFAGNALELWDCGYSTNEAIISNNTFQVNFPNGLILYNTIANLTMNKFIGNRTGLRLLNSSSAAIWGDKEAGSPSTTQYFYNNAIQGIYVSHASFHYFRANAFECSPPGSMVFIYHTGTPPSGSLDVRFNYWGTDFKPETQLLPDGSYSYDPIWYPGDGSSEDDAAKLSYDASNDLLIDGNYPEAETGFKEVVAQFPQSSYSHPALKKLFVIEQFSGKSFGDLKSYLLTDNVILNNPNLKKLSEKIANQCDIASENWEDAIGWLETEIESPESIEDSIYSIIDLGNTYLLMQNSGNKSSYYVGKYPEFKPKSKIAHFKTTEELLLLLPRDNSSQGQIQNLSSLDSGELLQNFPNPFKGSTQVWYKLENESIVQLSVYNYTGQLISTINEGTKTKGTHHIDFNANGMKNGIYFYSIRINGQTTDSKKMTIMK